MNRRIAWVLGLVIGLPALAIGAALLLFDAEALRPRLVAEVERATGRAFTVREIRLALSLRPALQLRGVTLANIPGGSRPEMLQAERVEVQVALLPLLSRRLDIARVVLDQPDLVLEPDAEGRGNWLFTRAAAPGSPSAGTPAEPRRPLTFALESLRLEGGRIAWRSGPAAAAETLEITSLEAGAPLGGPASLTAQGSVRGQPITLAATTGPLMSFRGAQPWPVVARVGVAGLSAELAFTLSDALRGLTLRLAAADLGTWRPGLRLTALEASAATLDSPLHLRAEASLDGTPIGLAGQLGTPGILLGAARGALPLDLTLSAADARATLRGALAQWRALDGADVLVALEVPDLAALSPLAGSPLPALTALRGGARLQGGPAALEVTDLTLTSSALELAGALNLRRAPRPAVTGRLAFAKLDLDALRVVPAPVSAPSAPAAPAAAPAPPSTRMIPSLPIPFEALRAADAALDLRIAALTTQGATTRDIALKLVLAEGKARIAPLTATTPAGPLALEIEADATASPPSLRVVARSEGLDLAMVTRAVGATPWLLGTVQINADLRGVGAETRAWAGSLAGHLGLAMVDGALSRDALRSVPNGVLETLAPGGLPPGDIAVRCFALRALAEAGVLRLATLNLEGALGTVGGGGTVDLGQETLALRLLADLRLGRISVRAPVNIVGSWRAPRIGVDPAAAAAAGLGALLSRQRTPDRTLLGLAEALGGAVGGGLGVQSGSACEATLAVARGGVAGPQPR